MTDETPHEHGSSNEPRSRPWLADLLASWVVFLVALPLCIGIAVACGVPAERGLVTGIIGGVVVGVFTGAPLLVSGPAASLIVPVVNLVRDFGVSALGPVVILAGLWQVIAGVFRLGQWFRAVAPAVITGMLIGIGLLICASQLHVAIDGEPRATFVENIATFPGALWDQLRSGEPGGLAAALIAATTIVLLVGWNAYRPRRLRLVPGHLVSVVVVTLAAVVFEPRIAYLDISPRFFAGLVPTTIDDFRVLKEPSVLGRSFVFAFVASAATLLTASAIDQRQTHTRTDYDREIIAQGVGNVLTGTVGGLPMTGVIVRSSVNVDAGAKTRLSTILHGLWILAFVVLVPEALERIPQASLGAILVYTGIKLIDYPGLVALYRQGRAELVIALITLFGVVFVALFAGIVAGLVAAFGKLIHTFSHLEIRSEPSPSEDVQHLHLTGSATFVQLPRLAGALDTIPGDRELHVHIDRLDHIDHACLELLSSWNRRRETEGLRGMFVEWDELTDRYRHAALGMGQRDPSVSKSLLSLVWDEWKRIYSPKARESSRLEQPWDDWIEASRVRLQVDAASIDEVIDSAAEVLGPAAGRSRKELTKLLSSRVEGHVTLGRGMSIPHTPVPGLDKPLAALIGTRQPLLVAGDPVDLFFVLLAPAEDPRAHLRSLAHVGRLGHDAGLLSALRDTRDPAEAAALLMASQQVVSTTGADLLVVLEVDGEPKARALAAVVDEAFGTSVVVPRRDARLFEPLRRILDIPAARTLLLLRIEARDLHLLHALLDERARRFSDDFCRVHVLRKDASASPR